MWNIWQAMGQLEERVRRLEAENAELRRGMKVKKLVYQIRSLHIKEMRGTLNIGITAPVDGSDMEQFDFDLNQDDK